MVRPIDVPGLDHQPEPIWVFLQNLNCRFRHLCERWIFVDIGLGIDLSLFDIQDWFVVSIRSLKGQMSLFHTKETQQPLLLRCGSGRCIRQ